MTKTSEWPLKIAKPAQRALANAGIGSLAQLAAYTEKELSEMHGIGPNALAKIKEEMKAYGMRFKK